MCAAGQYHEHVVKVYENEMKKLATVLQAALSDAAGCFVVALHKETSCLCVTSYAI